MTDQRGPFSPGDSCNGYQIIRVIGEGGFGSVYEAIQPFKMVAPDGERLGRPVALKCLRVAVAGDPDQIARLNREAHVLTQLDHPNIVRLIDCGTTDTGIVYFVMDLLRGQSLLQLRKTRRLSLARSLFVAVSIAEGMAHAHSKRVTHRDLKPGNVFITDQWEVKVLDLGAAKYRYFGAKSTEPGRAPWTPGYAAPEQIEGSPDVDRRADIFSLGVILYEMVAGQHPFAHGASGHAQILERQLVCRPRLLTELGAPADVAAIAHHAMSRNPEDRYQSMEELLVQLRRAIADYTARTRSQDEEATALAELANRKGLQQRILGNVDTDPYAPAQQPRAIDGAAQLQRLFARDAKDSKELDRAADRPNRNNVRLSRWEAFHARPIVRRVVPLAIAVLLAVPIAAVLLDWTRKAPEVHAQPALREPDRASVTTARVDQPSAQPLEPTPPSEATKPTSAPPTPAPAAIRQKVLPKRAAPQAKDSDDVAFSPMADSIPTTAPTAGAQAPRTKKASPATNEHDLLRGVNSGL